MVFAKLPVVFPPEPYQGVKCPCKKGPTAIICNEVEVSASNIHRKEERVFECQKVTFATIAKIPDIYIFSACLLVQLAF